MLPQTCFSQHDTVSLEQWFSTGGYFTPPEGIWKCPETPLIVTTGKLLLASRAWRPGMLPNILSRTGRPPQQRIILPKMSIALRRRGSVLECMGRGQHQIGARRKPLWSFVFHLSPLSEGIRRHQPCKTPEKSGHWACARKPVCWEWVIKEMSKGGEVELGRKL